MIEFRPLELSQKATLDRYLQRDVRGCEYSFANLYIWGRQKIAFYQDVLVFFSQFDRKSVYPFPLGQDLKPALKAIIQDAAKRGIPCRLTGLTAEDRALLEELYPGRFRFHGDRGGFDYVYAIADLAELKGRKYQRKRNHLNRFRQTFPDYTVEPIGAENAPEVLTLVEDWYAKRLAQDPAADFHMEQAALGKALRFREALGMEGLLLRCGGRPVAMTLGNFLRPDTFDVNFEKALDESAYPAINWEFARYLRQKYPDLQWLDREEDMGLEGLRKAKLSYCPHHMIEKYWACLLEDGYVY